jgi:hypothetical protein
MASKSIRTMTVAAAVAAFLLVPLSARALEVKKELGPMGGGGGGGGGGGASSGGAPSQANPIPAAMRQQLSQTISDESDSYLNQESEKKSSGQPYVDLEHAKFTYLPAQKSGKWTVQAKLEADEYQPSKSGEGKGRKTGKRKELVFDYRLDGNKWTELEPPKWQDVADAGAATAKSK